MLNLKNWFQKLSLNSDVIILSSLMVFPILHISKLPVLLYILIGYVLVFKRDFIVNNVNEISLIPLIIVGSWYLFSLISFFYSENLFRYHKIIIRNLPFILFPFFIFYGFDKITIKSINAIFKILIVAVLIEILFLYVGIVRGSNHFFNENTSVFNLIENFQRFFKHPPNELLGNFKWAPNRSHLFFHKVYFSIQNLLCIAFILKRTLESDSKKKIIIGVILLLLFSVSILFVFSVPNVILMILIYIYFFVRYFLKHPKLLILTFGSLLLILYSYSLSTGGEKYLTFQTEKIRTFIRVSMKQMANSNNVVVDNARIRTYSCAIKNIKENLIIGHGEGDVMELLLNCYKERGFITQLKEKQNSHNYYLDRLLSGGIIMLILFLMMLAYGFKIAITNKDILYTIFFIVICVNLFFENVFSRVYGIFLFAIINSIFIKYNHFKLKKNNRQKHYISKLIR